MGAIPAEKNLAVAVRGPYRADANEDLIGLVRQRYQCYVRGKTQVEAEELSNRCFDVLADSYPQAGIRVNEIIPLQDSTLIGEDEAGRSEFVFNFEVICWRK